MSLPITPGAYEPGNMGVNPRTAGWKSQYPVLDADRCNQCLKCWIFCPDSAIQITGEKVGFTLDYCKGCGICKEECPRAAIEMAR